MAEMLVRCPNADCGASYRVQDSLLGKTGKPDKTFLQRRPDPDEPGVWIWGLGAGEYMRKGPAQDWYRLDESRPRAVPARVGRRDRAVDPLDAAKVGCDSGGVGAALDQDLVRQ